MLRFELPVFILCIFSEYLRAAQLAGPYYIIPDLGEECPRSEMALDFPVKVKLVRERDNTNFFLVTVHWAGQFWFDDNKDARVVMASWGSRGGWKENALIMKFKKLCTTIKTHLPDIWNEIVPRMKSNITNFQRDCPFPPGAFSIEDLSTSVLQPKGVPYLFYGKWKIDVKAIDPADDRVLGCFRIYASIIPRTTQHGKG
ncbi:Arginine--tRNA ligase [Frankliniella fusca]|uniref:Arginine--tRNA ligase n=1 Tax=Frankliniella fusca TaxID=407009 RepID=A0AAE1GR95_9NEOP|nr:Arginine--tRNA ligase [Frankliniella fusca]